MSSSQHKTNRARLCRLIIDVGTKTVRKFFDLKQPPDTLTAVLHSRYDEIKRIKVINFAQMQKLFPPSGKPSTSRDYDITLLFILIRNICGLRPPASTGSWNENPPPGDHFQEADLLRLKIFWNFLHVNSTGVTDDYFNKYWTEVSEVLVRLGADVGDIGELKTSPLDEDRYISLLNEWYENDEKTSDASSDRLRSNGERLSRLIVDQGTEVVRKYFDSIFAPSTLKSCLCSYRSELNNLLRRRCINARQMNVLFPPDGSPPTSVNFDITLLFILLRNICGISAPASTGSWNLNPSPNDQSPAADLVRIKYYRNTLFAHCVSTEVSDVEFNIYWTAISTALVRLGADIEDIAKLKTSPLDGDHYTSSIKEWYYNEEKSKVVTQLATNENLAETIENIATKSTKLFHWLTMLLLLMIAQSVFVQIVSLKTLQHSSFPKIGYFYSENPSNLQLELDLLNASDVRGVLLVADPGWGKSAMMKDLIISPSSTPVIHGNIIGYHFCKFNEQSTRDGEQFVKGLVRSIAKNIAEFSEIVNEDQLIKYELQSNCHRKPLECFKTAVAKPLQKLNILGRNVSFILIDAVDECFETEEHHSSVILDILSSTVPELPSWVKLIITSRNQVQTTSYLSNIGLKTISYSLPETSGDTFISSISAMRFGEGDLYYFQPLLEVVLSASSPLTLFELEKIINYHYENYNTRKVVTKLSQYFKFGIDQVPLEFYPIFSEWLINQTDGRNGITIQKSRGHQYIVDYLFHFYSERDTEVTFEELLELCQHILHERKTSPLYETKLRLLNVSEVRDSSKRCVLHVLAPKRNSTELLEVLIKQFNSVDILDDRGWTPAMYAVEAGNYENLKLFIDNGASANHTIKRTLCSVPSFVIPHDYNMNFIAACRGYTKIAKLLIESGATFEEEDECGWKPLHWAAIMGSIGIVRLYLGYGAQADLIALHHAVARNHTNIVSLLLKTGIRDKCMPSKTWNRTWCCMDLNRFHHCFCESALYAAVSRDNLEIAELILSYGNSSVNCNHGSGRTPLMEAFSRQNAPMIKLLISAGADLNAQCENSTLDLYEIGKQIPNIYSFRERCNGHRVIDFSFAHGLWEMMVPLISEQKHRSSSDNVRWTPATVAAINDRVEFINATYDSRVNSIPNIKTVLRYVAVCHSLKTLQHLLNCDDLSAFTTVYEDGKSLLHFAILGSSQIETEAYRTQQCAPSMCVCPYVTTRSDIVNDKRLETVMLLTKLRIVELNKQDKYGRTVLHYAAVGALPELVEYLINAGVDWNIEDQNGDTALEFALQERPSRDELFLPCRWKSDHLFRVCQSTQFDEVSSYLLRNVTIKECNVRTKDLLNGLINHRLPLSLYALFKSGLDVNCAREQFKRLLSNSLVSRWNRRYEEIREVFKLFQIDVEVVCDIPLAESELHLMAYLKTPNGTGNLFQPSVNGTQFPLQRFIASHPNGVQILNGCYDREGYLAIHRAVLGRNFDAVVWFIKIGVNIYQKTKSGLTPLDLTICNLHRFLPPVNISYGEQKRIFDKLLEKMEEKSHVKFQCNSKLVDLSPLHVAGSRGMAMMEMIHYKIPTIPLNCTNRDGIQPIYLAYLYHATNSDLSWNDKQAFLDLSRRSPETELSKYPQREAEYHLIYNQYYLTPQEDLRHALNHDDLFECPGINDLLPHEAVIQEIMKSKGCTKRCWPSVLAASREFSANFPYLEIQNITISNPFTDTYIDIARHMAELRFNLVKRFSFNSKLWRKVTKAHSCAHTCACFEIMRLLQEKFTSKPFEYKVVGKFVAERMGWTNTARNGDVRYRWPFSFLFKKALGTEKAYKYLDALSFPF